MTQLSASKKVGACFARNYFRFTWARWETPGDGCAVQGMADAVEKGTIADMLKAAVLDPSFKQRVFE